MRRIRRWRPARSADRSGVDRASSGAPSPRPVPSGPRSRGSAGDVPIPVSSEPRLVWRLKAADRDAACSGSPCHVDSIERLAASAGAAVLESGTMQRANHDFRCSSGVSDVRDVRNRVSATSDVSGAQTRGRAESLRLCGTSASFRSSPSSSRVVAEAHRTRRGAEGSGAAAVRNSVDSPNRTSSWHVGCTAVLRVRKRVVEATTGWSFREPMTVDRTRVGKVNRTEAASGAGPASPVDRLGATISLHSPHCISRARGIDDEHNRLATQAAISGTTSGTSRSRGAPRPTAALHGAGI